MFSDKDHHSLRLDFVSFTLTGRHAETTKTEMSQTETTKTETTKTEKTQNAKEIT